MLTIVIEGCLKAVAKEIQVETIVLLECLLPTEIRIVLDRLVSSSYRRGSLYSTRLGITEEITVCISPVAHIIDQTIRTGDIWVSKIHESDFFRSLIITYETPRGTEFEERSNLGNWLPELLLTDNPTDRTSREGTETATWRKVLRTIITYVELCHVSVGIVVSYTTHKTYV